MDTADEYLGAGAAPDTAAILAGPGTVKANAFQTDSYTSGLKSLHPMGSPTPWVIFLALGFVLLLHPKVSGNIGGRAAAGARVG